MRFVLLMLAATFSLIVGLPVAHAVYPDDIRTFASQTVPVPLLERAAQRRTQRLQEALKPLPKVIKTLTSRRTIQRLQSKAEAARLRRNALEQARELRLRRRMATQEPANSPSTGQEMRDALFAAVNRERLSRTLAPLTYSTILETSAQLYAEDMHAREFFDHVSPDGTHPKDRMKAAGYGNISIADCDCSSFEVFFGENIAMGQTSVEQVLTDWMNSPTHREIILHEKSRETGIGMAGAYWVQHFGSIQIMLHDN